MSTETVAAARVVDSHVGFFGDSDDVADYGQPLAKKFGDLWEQVRVENSLPVDGDLLSRETVHKERFLVMCCKLRDLVEELTKESGNTEHTREQFAEALKAVVEIRRHSLVELEIVHDEVGICLADSDVEFIPRSITTQYSGSDGGHDFDLELQFDLLRVDPASGLYPKGIAVYSVIEV